MENREAQLSKAPKTKTFRRKLARAFVIFAVVPYVFVIVIFVVLQRQLMYQPLVAESLAIQIIGLDADFGRDVEVLTPDQITIRGWLVQRSHVHPPGDGWKPLVLYFPGNSLNRHKRVSDLREIAARGFDVLIFDYRGFGDSNGSPSEAALSADALLVWQYAIDALGYSEEQIVVFGESIGGEVALSLWESTNIKVKKPAALILSSTFASMRETVQWNYPLFPFHWLLFDRWPSSDRIKNAPSPVVIFHGTDDQMVPVSHGRDLARTALNPRFIEVPGGVHNEIPSMQLRRELDSILAEMRAVQDDESR